MKTLYTPKKHKSPVWFDGPDVQTMPFQVSEATGSVLPLIKIDQAFKFGTLAFVAGWTTAKLELGLVSDMRELETRTLAVERPDVATHFKLSTGDGLGFVLVSETNHDAEMSLCWNAGGVKTVSLPLRFSVATDWLAMSASEQALLGPAIGIFVQQYPPFTAPWISLVKSMPVLSDICANARGFLEGARASEKTKDAIVFGWFVNTPGSVVWLEDGSGNMHSLEGAYRQFRQDVHDAVGQEFGHTCREAGFIFRLHGLKPDSKVQLKALSDKGVHVLSECQCGRLSIDPVEAARVLFSLPTPIPELHRRIPSVDEPVLDPLIKFRQEMLAELPNAFKQLGEPVARPTVSIIVPLYGRLDFMEDQIIEFIADPWFKAHAELIYVLDDPNLAEALAQVAWSLHQLYHLPFQWVWGSVNRGFSGANNLGASRARGGYLVFLNSDAFPQKPGWLEALVEVLATRPDIGTVGPRLVHADGSIQHAGMEFMRMDHLGVWVNHHPCMGLDPSLDPHNDLTIVPAVTGACMAIRRSDFDRIGGWDTGYLIGDFEDSDLCMRLHAAGLKSAYLPTVQLTHLERQSFKLLGQDEFRSRVTMYNAVRHQKLWARHIEAAMSEPAAN